MTRVTRSTACVTLACIVWTLACGDSATMEPPPDPPRPTTVTVIPATSRLTAPGDTVQLSAEVRDQSGNLMVGVPVTWRSSMPAVAAVDATGLVRAVREGVAEIRAVASRTRGVAQITVFSPDRAALVALYHATDGPNWTNSDNWLTDAPLRSWHGVGTNSAGRVTSVGLVGHRDSQSGRWTSHGLKGTIPPEVGSLTELEFLWLYGNELSGTIPPFLGDLAKLKYLDLSGNELTGQIPPELGSLANLQTFAAHTNSIEGAIPPELGNLTRLETLTLSDNELSGTIPSALGDMAELRHLYLSDNNLTGPIPPELGGSKSRAFGSMGTNCPGRSRRPSETFPN